MEKEETSKQSMQEKHAEKGIDAPSGATNEELVLVKSNLSASRAEINALVRRVSELEGLNSRLREHILLRDSFERSMDKEYKRQLVQQDEVIRKLAALSTKDTHASSALAEAKPKALTAGPERQTSHETELQRLADHYRHSSEEHEKLTAHLTWQLNEKNSSIQRLKALTEEEELRQGEENRKLSNKLYEKEAEIRHLTQYYADKEQAYEAVQSQLSDRLKEKNRETERLKSFIAEREELAQKVEEQLQKEIAAKESELSELRHTKNYGKALALQRQLEHSEQIIKLKDSANKKILLELTSSKETGAILSRKLKGEQTHSESLKAQYERIIAAIKTDNERIMKGLIEDYNARVAAAKTETERIRAELSSKESELQIQKHRIDEAIREFGIRAQQVISMRESIEPLEKAATQAATKAAIQASQAAQQATPQQAQEHTATTTKDELDQYAKKVKVLREALYRKDRELTKREAEMKQKEGGLLSRETEVKAMISTAEQRLKELERREDSGDRKEQILLKQQEAFNRELQALEAAGSRLMTVESELESQLTMTARQATPEIPTTAFAPPKAREAPQQPESIAVLEPAPQKIVMAEKIKPEATIQKPEPKPIKPAPAAMPKATAHAIKPLLPKQQPAYMAAASEKPVGELNINLEEQTLGYSEVEEAMSMIDVAMQHKESIEQIKNSLLSSGYSKENVEKAMKRMNL